MENIKQEKSLKNSIDRVISTKGNLIEVDYALGKLIERTRMYSEEASDKCSGEVKAEPSDLIELLNEQTSDMSFVINNIHKKIEYLNNFIG